MKIPVLLDLFIYLAILAVTLNVSVYVYRNWQESSHREEIQSEQIRQMDYMKACQDAGRTCDPGVYR